MAAMKLIAATVLCVAAWSATVEASVTVSFVQPGRYQDASPREPALREIARFLERLGEQRLAPSQTLKIEVLDIDLVGEVNPMQASTPQARVLRPGTWPRIRLRFTLEEGGVVRAQGEERIADRDYQSHRPMFSDSDPLRYEKAMLQEWFTRRVAPARR
jgi:hypothetical protein